MNWRRIRKWSIVATLSTILILLIAAWIVGGMLVAPANRTIGLPPEDFPADRVSIKSKSGATLAAWELIEPDSRATVLLLHAIRSDRRSMLPRAKLLHERGYSVLLVDLQSHGESSGENITMGHREKHDVSSCVQYIRNARANDQIAIIGRSLGGASALFSRVDIDLLVIESVYPTITEAVHNRIEIRLGCLQHLLAPLLLYQLNPRLGVSPDDLRPIDQLPHLTCPVLIASGATDQHTTLEETKRMFESANEPKQLVIFEGVGHDDLLAAEPEKYENEILGFIDATLQANPDRELLFSRGVNK